MRKSAKRAKPSKRKNILGRIVKVTLAFMFIIILTIGLAGIVIYKSGEMSLKASASSQTPSLVTDEAQVAKIRENLNYNSSVAWQEDWVVYGDKVYEYREDALNFLLFGIDRKGELSSETRLTDWKAGQADVIFLLSLCKEDKTLSVIGIPRNSMVNVEVFNNKSECIDTIYDQICLQYGYAGGGELGLAKMSESVSELFGGLPIHGACAVSYDAVSELTDRLGGIEVVVPDDMTAYNSAYVQGSTQTLTGKNVVNYLRYRDMHTLGSPTVRLARQKAFMRTAATRMLQEIKANPAFVKETYEAVKPYMNTDISIDEAVYTAAQALDCTFSAESFYQLSGEDRADYIDDEGDYYNDYYLDEEALKDLIMRVFYKEVSIGG